MKNDVTNKVAQMLAELDEDSQEGRKEVFLKLQKKSFKDQISALSVIPEENKKQLVEKIDSADETKFEDLKKHLKDVMDYVSISVRSNVFTEDQIKQAVSYLTTSENIKNAGKFKEMLERNFIPEEKKSMEMGLYWYDFDPVITEQYHANVKKEAGTEKTDKRDKREILFESVEENLLSKYDVILESAMDLSSPQAKKKKEKLTSDFKLLFGSDVENTSSRHEHLIKARAFLLELAAKKSPAYKDWYNKQKKKWAKIGNGRLIEIFDALSKDHFWEVSKNDEILSQAKKVYAKELASKFGQVVVSAFPDDSATQKDWTANFDKAELEVKISMYEGLMKDKDKFSKKDKDFHGRIAKHEKASIAIFHEFNKRYLLYKNTKNREDILTEVEKEYEQKSKDYEALVKLVYVDSKKQNGEMIDFNNLDSFESMDKKIKAVHSEMELNSKKPSRKEKKSDKKESKAEEEVKLPEGIEEHIANAVGSFVHSEDGKRSFLLKIMMDEIVLSQRKHQQKSQSKNMQYDVANKTDTRLEGLKDANANESDAAQKAKNAEMYAKTRGHSFTKKQLTDQRNNVLREYTDRESLATEFYGITQQRMQNPNYVDSTCAVKDDNGDDLNFWEQPQHYDQVYGNSRVEEDEVLAGHALSACGIDKPDSAVLDKVCEMVSEYRDNYEQSHKIDMLRTMMSTKQEGEETKTEAASMVDNDTGNTMVNDGNKDQFDAWHLANPSNNVNYGASMNQDAAQIESGSEREPVVVANNTDNYKMAA